MWQEINKKRFKAYIIGFSRSIGSSFKNAIQMKFIPLHILMIIVSIPLVIYNFDWNYFLLFRNYKFLTPILFIAVPLGTFIPFLVPPIFYLYGKLKEYRELEVLGMVLTQTAVVGLFWSALYKSFTGRQGPEFRDYEAGIANYSQDFYFGFLLGGVFDGWPSGHTTINVAIAVCLFYFRPDEKLSKIWENERNWVTFMLRNRKLWMLYGLYIGFGVSTNIHWFSDFIAGLLLGYCVGKSCSEIANQSWLNNDGELNNIKLNEIEMKNYDKTVYITFFILFLTIIFSIFVPREVFNL